MGANDYLTKPFTRRELIARVDNQLKIKKLADYMELAITSEKIFFAKEKRMKTRLLSSRERLVQQNVSFSRFVPKESLALLAKKDVTKVELGDHKQIETTVMFCDIRSFTRLSESMSPEDTFFFINAFLKRLEPIIRANNGFIDKFTGDGIMALFTNSADDAVTASSKIIEAIHSYNDRRLSKGFEAITIGIGIHHGTVIMGTVGTKQRMETTVIADVVNTTSRIEGLTKVYQTPTLISKVTLDHLKHPENFKTRLLDSVKVKGKEEAVEICEVLEGHDKATYQLKLATLTTFNQAVQLFRAGKLKEAKALFEEVFTQNPNDHCSQIYIDRCGES